jgi:hypothetical protein
MQPDESIQISFGPMIAPPDLPDLVVTDRPSLLRFAYAAPDHCGGTIIQSALAASPFWSIKAKKTRHEYQSLQKTLLRGPSKGTLQYNDETVRRELSTERTGTPSTKFSGQTRH